jgi:hypothetical protein
MDQEGEALAQKGIPPEEPLARFEYDHGAYIRADGNPRPRAFNPKLDVERNRLETSVFQIGGVDAAGVWNLGDLYGQRRMPPKNATGYCSVLAAAVAEANLHAERDEPPDRHAVIVGWSDAEEKRLESANLLAKAAAGRAVRR